MPGPANQLLPALTVYAARALENLSRRDAGTLPAFDTHAAGAFVRSPEVQNAARGAAAVGASFMACHHIENLVAGTDALRELGRKIIASSPVIARLLLRTPNAALVAGMVAFPYAASPFFEKWFKQMLGYEDAAPGRRTPVNWEAGFLATVLNWNHVQPLLGKVLGRHPAVLAMARPLATGVLSAGVDGIKSEEAHRERAQRMNANEGGDETELPFRATAGQAAAGKVAASTFRYFADAVRQSLRHNTHAPGALAGLITSALYPGWVAALANTAAPAIAQQMGRTRARSASTSMDGEALRRELGLDKTASSGAGHVGGLRGRSASEASSDRGSPPDILAMLALPEVREMLRYLEVHPKALGSLASGEA